MIDSRKESIDLDRESIDLERKLIGTQIGLESVPNDLERKSIWNKTNWDPFWFGPKTKGFGILVPRYCNLWSQMSSDDPISWQMTPAGLRWTQMSRVEMGWARKMTPDESRWSLISRSESRWSQVIPGPDNLRWVQMIPNYHKWSQLIPDDHPEWSQMISLWSKMISDDPRWCKMIQMSLDQPRWSQTQMISDDPSWC